MPKLSKFRKALRLAEAATKHAFLNINNHKTEAYSCYIAESKDIVAKRLVKNNKRQTAHIHKFPTGQP